MRNLTMLIVLCRRWFAISEKASGAPERPAFVAPTIQADASVNVQAFDMPFGIRKC